MKNRSRLDELLAGLAAIVSKKRKELGLTQEDLAQATGLHRTYISDIERGKRNITLGVLYVLGEALNLSAIDLLSKAEEYETVSLYRKAAQ